MKKPRGEEKAQRSSGPVAPSEQGAAEAAGADRCDGSAWPVRLFSAAGLVANFLLVGVSFGALITLEIGYFRPWSLLAVGAVPVGVLIWAFRPTGYLSAAGKGSTAYGWWRVGVCLLLLAIAFCLRYPTSQYVHGGQDQGTYINMGSYFARHGTLARHDEILADAFTMNVPFALQLVYNPGVAEVSGEYEGERCIGFPILDRKRGKVVPQFYPLTALWLGIGCWLFGQAYASSLLPVFGVLSAVACALLAHRVWSSAFVTVLTLLVLLFSGIQVFFSTFPVSEIVSQYFIMTGLWVLAWAMLENRTVLFVLAGLNLAVALLNHISTIFYLGPVTLFFVAVWIVDGRRHNGDPQRIRGVTLFYYLFLFAAAVSLVPAWIHHGHYVFAVFRNAWRSVVPLGVNRTFLLLYGAILIAACLPLALRLLTRGRLSHSPQFVARSLLVLSGVVVALIAGKLLLYKLGLIDVKYTFIESINCYVSPLGWPLVIWGMYRALRGSYSWGVVLPLLSLVWFSFLFLFLKFKTGYHWYYCRYYVKEIYPLVIVFAVYGIWHIFRMGGVRAKVAGVVLAVALFTISAYPNLYVVGKPVLDGAYGYMEDLDGKLEERSIVLYVRGQDRIPVSNSYGRFSVSLPYSFDHDLIWVPLSASLRRHIESIRQHLERYDRPVYVLYVANEPLPELSVGARAKLISSDVHTFTRPEMVLRIPRMHQLLWMPVHLYRLRPPSGNRGSG
ncbi:hypothetical protein ACFL59_04400 [Planctomycetota bacterium]